MQNNCRVSDKSNELSAELTGKILKRAAVYKKQNQSKKKKKYINEALRSDQ